jgi:hypothetical protein
VHLRATGLLYRVEVEVGKQKGVSDAAVKHTKSSDIMVKVFFLRL